MGQIRIMKNLFILLLTCTQAFAQQTIRGNFFNKNGSPIIGASVYIEGSYDGTSSDLEGYFIFTTSLTGSQLLIVSYIGFDDFKEVIIIENVSDLSIILLESLNRMDAVVITAGSFEASDDNKSPVLRPLDNWTG